MTVICRSHVRRFWGQAAIRLQGFMAVHDEAGVMLAFASLETWKGRGQRRKGLFFFLRFGFYLSLLSLGKSAVWYFWLFFLSSRNPCETIRRFYICEMLLYFES